jgi:hypothetical protein
MRGRLVFFFGGGGGGGGGEGADSNDNKRRVVFFILLFHVPNTRTHSTRDSILARIIIDMMPPLCGSEYASAAFQKIHAFPTKEVRNLCVSISF